MKCNSRETTAPQTPEPRRLHCRAPGFYIFSAVDEMLKESMISDFAANLGSLAIVAGELDR